ncbi:DNA-directed RNA polymerase, mitochondrial-like [Ischnura elegans]|uniref:DNA-directed RNA polymerase, mitochondrial-like n=1 Tax=Ischnura elegans TaxID=197161 RepID=UPI001ED894B2|nr:DNA-directed RNA polymerase, mitochondrial-like [Ischnura elegans]
MMTVIHRIILSELLLKPLCFGRLGHLMPSGLRISSVNHNDEIYRGISKGKRRPRNLSSLDGGKSKRKKELPCKSSLRNRVKEVNSDSCASVYNRNGNHQKTVGDVRKTSEEGCERSRTMKKTKDFTDNKNQSYVSPFEAVNEKRVTDTYLIAPSKFCGVESNDKKTLKDQSQEMRTHKVKLGVRKQISSLLSYVDVCISGGYVNQGLKAAMLFRNRCKKMKDCDYARVMDIRVVEILLHGYAAQSNIHKVEELVKVTTEDGIPLTAQCYAACFECVGHMLTGSGKSLKKGLHTSDSAETKVLKKLIAWECAMSRKGIKMNDLLVNTMLLSHQKKMVLTAIKKVDSNFNPISFPRPEIDYSLKLLQDLNKFPFTEYKSPVSNLVDAEQLKILSLKQLQNEVKGYLEVKSVDLRKGANERGYFSRERFMEVVEEWHKIISKVLHRQLQTLQSCFEGGKKTNSQIYIYPYLASVEESELVELILQEIQKLAHGSETFSYSTNQLFRDLGGLVLDRYIINWKKRTGVIDMVKKLHSKYCEWYCDPKSTALSEKPITCTRKAWLNLYVDSGLSLQFREKCWPVAVQIAIGKFLYGIIIHEIMIDLHILHSRITKSKKLPAFYIVYRSQQQGKFLKEEVKPHPVLARLIRSVTDVMLKFPTSSLPMLCPPKPWTTYNSGGYLVSKTDVIRLSKEASIQWNRLRDCPVQQLYPALDSLNQLGAVPWKINKPILDLLIRVFNGEGSSIPAISNLTMSFSSPLVPHPARKLEISNSSSYDNKKLTFQSEHVIQQRYCLYLRKKKAEAHSQRCDLHYRLSIANHLRDSIFWLPHNMDFRGRVYPCPPHLNHLGSDLARSMLCFAEGKPLGPRGFNWLKLHLVNLTGLKKNKSIEDRLKFVDEIIPQVVDSAEKPLTGGLWWAASDEPWQTLAVCMEIQSALKNEGGPENYKCHFPIHQDGSCNGLQHYAALGRDAAGAASVSMTPSNCPEDVYANVTAMVERERQSDAKLGVAIAQILEGFVKRKVIKQTVMTTVYGVTRFGARLQIARQLRDIDEFPKEHVWNASTYLASKTFGCLREMFTSTREIQDWFTDCAKIISKTCRQCVEWVTPLGLPVVQPYQHVITSKRQGSSIPLVVSSEWRSFVGHEQPNVTKQKNAFPPNFIHSLDSCHMMLTSLWCERKGLTFVSVHDCYWTHPSTVDLMNRICREQFVSLHSEPILEDLSAFLMQKFGYLEEDGRIMDVSGKKLNSVLRKVPKKGNFDLKQVLDSVYFFS